MLRVIVPDSHGQSIDPQASRAFLDDLRYLDPGEMVLLGDHLDAGGVFSAHPRQSPDELSYSYVDDCKAANDFLDLIQARAKNATIHYLEGNHEFHLARWAARTFSSRADAEHAVARLGPAAELRLKGRGIRYYRADVQHHGIASPGAIRLGRCVFTHGSRAGKYATAATLDDFGCNVVHGHTHRAQSFMRRTAASGEIGAWCPGTLSVLQPIYLHTSVSSWSHGYAIQFVQNDGRFVHVNVPIARGVSMLKPMLKAMNARK
jgi:predicted phosphodiesterase